MAKPTDVRKRPCSPQRLAANRANSLHSTGARTPEGKARSSMNACKHGMRSDKLLLPGESGELLAEKEQDILEAIDPRDGVERMLADRIVTCYWYRLRGQRAIEAQARRAIDAIVEGAGDRAAREVQRWAPLINGDAEPIRQLRSFPAGVAYLRKAWSVLARRLSGKRNLLGSQRVRCFTLSATRPTNALRDDPEAARWLRAQIGVMLGREATLAQIAEFLGGGPPEGMSEAEFTLRLRYLAESLLPKEESFQLLRRYVSRKIAESNT